MIPMQKHVFLPDFKVKGYRYRCRFRLIEWRVFKRVKDCYPQGDVYRFWMGWILMVVMVDRGVND